MALVGAVDAVRAMQPHQRGEAGAGEAHLVSGRRIFMLCSYMYIIKSVIVINILYSCSSRQSKNASCFDSGLLKR
jgi:hypothetical protein